MKFEQKTTRRNLIYVNIFGTTQLHLRNPLVIAAWSVAFPGMGHLLLSKYLRGLVLFLWEILINYKAHVNLLILYSCIGNFEKAKQVVNIQWLSLYLPIYIFAIWDSYRSTVDLNHVCLLARREDKDIIPFKMNFIEINYLDKRNPWVATTWSLLVPGSGQLYLHRLITAFFLIVWWIIICYNSKFLPSAHCTLLGDFKQAKELLNMQWFLNIPSVYLYAMYDAYTNTVETNKLFDWDQAKFLKKEYQSSNFNMTLKNNESGVNMHIVSTFDHSIYLELAISEIQMKGIKKENILAIPIDKRDEDIKLFDSIHSSDGLSLFDLPAILGVIFGIFGEVYGFILKWGPFLWGLIGILIGGLLGLIIKLILTKNSKRRSKDKRGTEVVLIIECLDTQIDMIKSVLWSNKALGVSSLSINNN
ncbi:hypothetical protein JHL18_13355 [Clostridium sp. YIM B02505]|uniref:Uncharacterized protein n=2 Tax=Clostridium yunnanense TaxID=2800325 RepID=A0ABS1EQC1_9CLOT|nr:hypothetical protein [Clostridium yunnanense]